MYKYLLVMFPLLAFLACTQMLDEVETVESSYDGNDGCVYCHTNKARLQALAPEVESDSESGGGG